MALPGLGHPAAPGGRGRFGVVGPVQIQLACHAPGDAHIYTNHFDQVHLQLSREPRPLPKMNINPDVKDIFSFNYDDFTLEGYDPHPHIKGIVAV